jgi:trans-2,3-dihydro-3-hydroxyanthranilate isomerase
MSDESRHPYAVLDVFTDTPLQGNPVAIFTDGDWIAERRMGAIAREMNLSETVFLLSADDPAQADARVRIFTPATELPFAGHPVLGTAFLLAEQRGLEHVRLQTGSGIISIELVRNGERIVSGEMTQPVPRIHAFDAPGQLLAAIGVERSMLPIELYDNGPQHTAIELADEAAVTALSPDMNALAALGSFGVSCFALDEDRVHARVFCPGLGVPEDPATGSAAGPLAVHLARHGRTAFGQPITITQGVEIGRPSRLLACAFGSAERVERVAVAGSAVLVAQGEYRIG